MSEKINIKIPEVATVLLRLKQKAEDEKKSEEQKRFAEIIKDYAYVLGWYTTEDGPINIESTKQGLVELIQEILRIESLMGEEREERFKKITGIEKEDVLRDKKIMKGYRLLDKVFMDFNGFVSEIWREFDGERRSAFNSEVAKWEKEKGVFEALVKEEAGQLLRESVEAALVAKNEARLAEGKKKVGVLRWEERYPIESGVKERQAEKKFDKAKPVLTENQAHSKMKAQKLDLEELEREVGKLEK